MALSSPDNYANWPYKVVITKNQNDAIDWCFNNYGPQSTDKWQWFGFNVVAFRHEKDAIWFSLKWG